MCSRSFCMKNIYAVSFRKLIFFALFLDMDLTSEGQSTPKKIKLVRFWPFIYLKSENSLHLVDVYQMNAFTSLKG